MEHELLVSGIGGQGIQLLSKALALAAIHEGRYAMLSAEFGGAMRGGHSQSTVVLGDAPLHALPVVAAAASGMALHHHYWENVTPRLKAGSVLVYNASLFEEAPSHSGPSFPINATDIASEVATVQSSGFVLLGAYVVITDIVKLGSVEEAIAEVIPPYRRQHIEANVNALRAGAEVAPRNGAVLSLAPVGTGQ